MTSKERVIKTIKGEKTDRMPLYGWVFLNLEEEINKEFGSVAAFEDKYEFDATHILVGVPTPYPAEECQRIHEGKGELTPSEYLDIKLKDVDDETAYEEMKKQISHHKERDRFIYVQTPGFFECHNDPFKFQNHLMYLLIYKEELHEVYARQAEWTKKFAYNCLDLGVDMIHVSDDWGSQESLLFSPETWWEMMFPYHKIVIDAVKKRDGFVSLHSDGNVTEILDGIVKLGYDVVHPYQESANMSLDLYNEKYADYFAIMGGLDVQSTVGFNKYTFLQSEIKRVVSTMKKRGMILCTSHFIQDHCSIEELELTFDTAYKLIRE